MSATPETLPCGHPLGCAAYSQSGPEACCWCAEVAYVTADTTALLARVAPVVVAAREARRVLTEVTPTLCAWAADGANRTVPLARELDAAYAALRAALAAYDKEPTP